VPVVTVKAWRGRGAVVSNRRQDALLLAIVIFVAGPLIGYGAGLLILLRHKASGMCVTAVQHGHRSSFRTRSTIRVRRMVEIEFAT
jgi:hypothetical protein